MGISFVPFRLPDASHQILRNAKRAYSRSPREAILLFPGYRLLEYRILTSGPPLTANGPQSSLINIENGKKCLLRHLDPADLLHTFLALLLLFQKLSFTADISAVTFGKNVLAHS